jgi:hypothetical protein
LKAVVEAWQKRRSEAAKPAEDSVPEKAGRGSGQAGKSQRRGRDPDQDVEVPAKGGSTRRRNKNAAESLTLEDAEQPRLRWRREESKLHCPVGKPRRPTHRTSRMFRHRSSRPRRTSPKLWTRLPRQDGGDAPETEVVSFTKPDTRPSEGAADAPLPAAPTTSGSVPQAAGADAEIARLQAHVEDLRRENGMLWDQVRHEREARIREIELLNGMIEGMRR